MDVYHKIQTVYKRDPETNNKTLIEGNFSIPEFDFLKNNQWVFTEKIDGTNIRVMWKNGKISFQGKTDKAQIPIFLFEQLQTMFSVEEFKDIFPDHDVCLYGEGYGARIQTGGGNYISGGVSFILFDIKIGQWWLKREDIEDIAKKLNLEIVPIIGKGTLIEGVELTRQGFKSNIGTQTAEGLVMRPEIELIARNGRRIIAKIKHKDFRK